MRYNLFLLMLLSCFVGSLDRAMGQLNAPTQRVWANTETNTSTIFLSSVTSASNAADQDSTSATVSSAAQTASNLNILADLFGLLGPTQTVTFANAVPAGTPIHVKYGLNIGVATLGQSITIEARNSAGTTIGTISSSTLLGLLAGSNTAEAVFSNLTQACKSIKISYSSAIAVATTMNNYGAYYEIASTTMDPYKAVDVLAGTETSSIANAASLLAGVNSPYLSIDGDESTAATLAAVANIIAQQQLTALFAGLQPAGTYAHVLIGVPGNLLSLGLIDGPLTIQLLNNGVVTDTYNADNWALLSISLLSPGSDKGWIEIPSTQPFNGIKIISNSGVANVLQSLNVYEINRSLSSYALPVSYSKPLSASLQNDGTVLLHWTTGVEINNKYFDVLRSANGRDNWKSIGKVLSKGNSTNDGNFYTHLDANPLNGNNYYRLVQYDTDGKYQTGHIVSVNISGWSESLRIVPNPASTYCQIQGIETGQQVFILGINGTIQRKITLSSQTQKIDITSLVPGMYFVMARRQDGTVLSEKLIKR